MSAAVPQTGFTIVAPVKADPQSLRDLEALLARIDPVTAKAPEIPYSDFKELHYCSFVLVVRPAREPYLTFEGNIDGERDAFLDKLATHVALREVYSCCSDFDQGDLAAYLKRHDVGAGTWYVALRGRSAVEIQKDAALREGIEAFIEERSDLRGMTPTAIHAAIASHVRSRPELAALAADPPETAFLQLQGRRITIGAGAVLALLLVGGLFSWFTPTLLVGAAAALFYLRRLERSDPEEPVTWDRQALDAANAREDRSLQNHMCSVADVKPGAFRMALLRTSLTVIGLAHRFWFNRGDLGGIPTIHFARWVILPERRELVFFSNFDGSWERYLGDFIEQASIGLNAVWANSGGYPKTRYLVLGGAEDEERFKSFARNSMWATRAWYAAYRRLSIQNLLDNAQLRAGLAQNLSGQALEDWLRLL